jgi:methionyl-tRNA formyltransferase
MKILILSGSHSRHLYVHQAVLNSGAECAAIVMEREGVIPRSPSGIDKKSKENFTKHFDMRYEIESEAYGNLQPDKIFSNIPVLMCNSESLNSQKSVDFARKFSADIAFIFGTDIIKEPLLSILPKDKVNLHLGLSPWYRGSATLFWPFYFLQPQYAGATFHKITKETDAGDILHQCIPILEYGDGIHDVGVKTVVKAKHDLIQLLDLYKQGVQKYQSQKSTGRLFLTKDFEPAHLRVIYDLYENKVVDMFLDGKIGNKKPDLISAL